MTNNYKYGIVIIEKERKDTKIMKKFFENQIGFMIMFMLIIGQCTVGEWFFFGQVVYLIANIGSTIRDFVLKRPASDKVKNICFSAITLGLILVRIFR